MSLRVGFFPAFKSRDTVLISGTPRDISELKLEIEKFDRSTANTVDLGAIAKNTSRHRIELWLAKSMADAQRLSGFALICSKEKCSEILEMLEPLIIAAKGHQYFDLIGGSAHLTVSVGEYSEQWWEDNAQ